MPPILNAQGLTKAFGATALFRDIAFTVSDGDRIGLIGPNGAGKSTLLKVLAAQEDADAGDVAVRKRARVGYVEQESNFAPGQTVRAVIEAALVRAKVAEGKQAYMEAQSKLQDALKNRVKTEVEWLRRGPKARATKAKARIDNAQELIGQLKEVNARVQTATAGIDFSATDRQTKRLIELDNVSVVLGDRKIVEGLNF